MDYVLLRKIFRDCFRVDHIDYERVPVLTIAHDNDRSLLHDGKYYSPLIDTMEDDLALKGVECVSVARIISAVKGDLSYGNARSPEGRFARALVAKRIKGLFNRGRYSFSGLEESTWGAILDRTGAKKVFGIQPSRELCSACHARGVWVADVQHGVIAEMHPWYGERFRARDPRPWLPDAFLLWDRGSQEVIEPWAAPLGIDCQVIGNRWLRRFMHPVPEDTLVAELDARHGTSLAKRDSRPTVLISLSWGEDSIPNGFIIEGLENVIRNTSQRFRWMIRLHPNQIKGFASHESPRFLRYFADRLNGFAEWESATWPPLPVVLRHVDLHISWMSSVCIEAAQMGVSSALLSPKLRAGDDMGSYYSHYRAAGMVEFVPEDAVSISGWLDRVAGTRHSPEDYSPYDARYASLLQFLAS